MTYPTPTEPGWYFARHKLRSRIEPVEVALMEHDSSLRGLVAGVPGSFDLDSLTWGPRITMPEDLAVEEAGR